MCVLAVRNPQFDPGWNRLPGLKTAHLAQKAGGC
jgi:hypothetical protein